MKPEALSLKFRKYIANKNKLAVKEIKPAKPLEPMKHLSAEEIKKHQADMDKRRKNMSQEDFDQEWLEIFYQPHF